MGLDYVNKTVDKKQHIMRRYGGGNAFADSVA